MQDHPKFGEVAQVAPLLFSRELQMGEEKLPKPTTLGSAVSAGASVSSPGMVYPAAIFKYMVAAQSNSLYVSVHGRQSHGHAAKLQPFSTLHGLHTY